MALKISQTMAVATQLGVPRTEPPFEPVLSFSASGEKSLESPFKGFTEEESGACQAEQLCDSHAAQADELGKGVHHSSERCASSRYERLAPGQDFVAQCDAIRNYLQSVCEHLITGPFIAVGAVNQCADVDLFCCSLGAPASLNADGVPASSTAEPSEEGKLREREQHEKVN